MQNEFPTSESLEMSPRAAALNDSVAAEAAAIKQYEDEQAQQAAQAQAQSTEPQPTFLSETGAAIAGGAADAVESVGGFAELTGDTLKTGFNQLMGRPLDDTQNPFSDDYRAGDAGWLDIPDTWVPENKTGLGKFARGLVEFGFLTAATGGIGGATLGGARIGVRGLAAARAAGVSAKGTRMLNFVRKTGKIAGEGAIADLVSSSSEAANLANLAEEHTPWMAPWITQALAIDPEDNPWLARIKTVGSGAGFNLVGHGIAAFAKGAWAAHRARAAGKSVDEANEIGNKVMQDDLDKNIDLDNAHADEMAADRFAQGRGISTADPRDEYLRTYLDEKDYAQYKESADPNIEALADQRGAAQGDVFDFDVNLSTNQAAENLGRQVDPFVNPGKFDVSEYATYRSDPNPTLTVLREGVQDMKQGGEGRSFTPIMTESSLNQMSRGDKNLRQYIIEVAEDLAKEAFKSLENTLSHKEVKELIIRQASELTSMMEGGGDIAKRFADYFEKENKNARVYINDGNKIVTGSPASKAALQLVINSLAKQAQGIATGTMFIADGLPINRQVEMVFDAMKVALVEHKKMGYMWGLDGKYQQVGLMPKAVKKSTEAQLKKIDDEMDELFNAYHALNKKGDYQGLKDLMELHALSGGNVRTLEHIHDYLKSKLYGGRMNGVNIKGRLRKEIQSTFYNSVLSSLKTPIKAIGGTNLIGILRPMQAYLGAGFRGNKKEMAIAAATLDALGQAWAEGIMMFKYNWDLGFNRKSLTYEGKFDLENDLAEWQSLKPFYDKYGSAVEKNAYGALDAVVNFNTNPWVKYSQNAMGAGDALARTIIGRYEMRMRAARKAIDEGKSLDDITKFAREYEENFRGEIFKKNADGKYVVSDKAAKMAGDEAAMTRALEENFSGFERISNIAPLKAFFPFVRTGFNAIDLTFQHTPLVVFRDKYRDIMSGTNLDKYGIRPEDLPQAQALIEGRVVMGSTIMSMAALAALTGKMTGDYPYNQDEKDAWVAAGIQPFSFVVGVGKNKTYISYKDLEPFNTLFSMAANVVQTSDVLGEKLTENWMKKLTYMTAAVLVDKSMLTGVEDLARVMNEETSENLLTRFGSRYIRSHFPFAGLLGQLGDVMDANRKEAVSLKEMAVKRDALFKSILPPKYDILNKDRSGVPLKYGAENPLLRLFNALSPIAVVNVEDDTIRQNLVDIRFNMPEMLTQYKGVELDSQMRSEMQKYMSMGSLRADLEKIMIDDDAWRRDFDAYKANKLTIDQGFDLYKQTFYTDVQKVFQRAKDEAIKQVYLNNPQLRDKIDRIEMATTISKAGVGTPSMQHRIEELRKLPK